MGALCPRIVDGYYNTRHNFPTPNQLAGGNSGAPCNSYKGELVFKYILAVI